MVEILSGKSSQPYRSVHFEPRAYARRYSTTAPFPLLAMYHPGQFDEASVAGHEHPTPSNALSASSDGYDESSPVSNPTDSS
jgi:hypothetical protein